MEGSRSFTLDIIESPIEKGTGIRSESNDVVGPADLQGKMSQTEGAGDTKALR